MIEKEENRSGRLQGLSRKAMWRNILEEFSGIPWYFAVPFDCPRRWRRIKNCWELQSLSDYDVSWIAGDVWVKHTLVHGMETEAGRNRTYPEPFSPEQCIMIANLLIHGINRSLFGRWAHSGGGFDFTQSFKKEEQEFLPTAWQMRRCPAGTAENYWNFMATHRFYTPKRLPGYCPQRWHNRTKAQFENHVEGAVWIFLCMGMWTAQRSNAKVHTRCKSMAAAAEWVVDISKCDADAAGIEFDSEWGIRRAVEAQ